MSSNASSSVPPGGQPVTPATPAGLAKAALRRRLRMMIDLVDDRTLRSVALWAELAATPEYASAGTVMAFVGVRGEPDTDPLFERVRRDGKRLVLPFVDGPDLVPREIGRGLEPGAFGVPAPQGEEVAVADVDLVVVPGLGFTTDGRRIGHGGGFYDRFLPRVAASCAMVGVCFAEQLLDELPLDDHDVRLHRVLAAPPLDDDL